MGGFVNGIPPDVFISLKITDFRLNHLMLTKTMPFRHIQNTHLYRNPIVGSLKTLDKFYPQKISGVKQICFQMGSVNVVSRRKPT